MGGVIYKVGNFDIQEREKEMSVTSYVKNINTCIQWAGYGTEIACRVAPLFGWNENGGGLKTSDLPSEDTTTAKEVVNYIVETIRNNIRYIFSVDKTPKYEWVLEGENFSDYQWREIVWQLWGDDIEAYVLSIRADEEAVAETEYAKKIADCIQRAKIGSPSAAAIAEFFFWNSENNGLDPFAIPNYWVRDSKDAIQHLAIALHSTIPLLDVDPSEQWVKGGSQFTIAQWEAIVEMVWGEEIAKYIRNRTMFARHNSFWHEGMRSLGAQIGWHTYHAFDGLILGTHNHKGEISPIGIGRDFCTRDDGSGIVYYHPIMEHRPQWEELSAIDTRMAAKADIFALQNTWDMLPHTPNSVVEIYYMWAYLLRHQTYFVFTANQSDPNYDARRDFSVVIKAIRIASAELPNDIASLYGAMLADVFSPDCASQWDKKGVLSKQSGIPALQEAVTQLAERFDLTEFRIALASINALIQVLHEGIDDDPDYYQRFLNKRG